MSLVGPLLRTRPGHAITAQDDMRLHSKSPSKSSLQLEPVREISLPAAYLTSRDKRLMIELSFQTTMNNTLRERSILQFVLFFFVFRETLLTQSNKHIYSNKDNKKEMK